MGYTCDVKRLTSALGVKANAIGWHLAGRPADERLCLIKRAKASACFAWPLHWEEFSKLNCAEAPCLAACYRNAREDLLLAHYAREHKAHAKGFIKQAYQLLADDLSATHFLLETSAIRDEDVAAAHSLLRTWLALDHIFLHRHMTESDPADPWAHLERHTAAMTLRSRLQASLHTGARRGSEEVETRAALPVSGRASAQPSFQHGMALLDVEREWRHLGGAVSNRRGTGELVFTHPAVDEQIVVNGRRKDAPRELVTRMRKLVNS